MFKAKKVIPALATGALTLAGCGGDNPSLSGAINNVCSQFRRCFPEEFSMYFDSLQECVDYYTDYYNEYLEGVSGACRDAVISYLNCYASLGCNESTDRCDDALNAAAEACSSSL